MDASDSLQISVKLGRPVGRRTTRSRVLDQLKRQVCEEVAAEIRKRRLTDTAIDRLLGRRTDSRLLPSIRAGDWRAVGPDVLLCLAEKLHLPVISRLEASIMVRDAA